MNLPCGKATLPQTTKGARAYALAPFGETDLQFAGSIGLTDLLLPQQQPQQQRPFPRQCRGGRP